MLEHMDALANTAAQAISNIKFDKVIVWENGANGNGTATSHFLQNLAHSLPPMMQIMKDVGGVELPEYIAKLAPDGKTAEHAPENKAVERAQASPPPPAKVESAKPAPKG